MHISETDLQTLATKKKKPPETVTVIEELEEGIHMALVAWARLNEYRHPALKWLHHTPNQKGTRHVTEMKKLSALGVKSGVFDLFLPFPASTYHGLWIELKSKAGAKTKEQLQFQKDMTAVGYRAVFCRSFDSARDELLDYLALPAVELRKPKKEPHNGNLKTA
jgi:hypothetical protein